MADHLGQVSHVLDFDLALAAGASNGAGVGYIQHRHLVAGTGVEPVLVGVWALLGPGPPRVFPRTLVGLSPTSPENRTMPVWQLSVLGRFSIPLTNLSKAVCLLLEPDLPFPTSCLGSHSASLRIDPAHTWQYRYCLCLGWGNHPSPLPSGVRSISRPEYCLPVHSDGAGSGPSLAGLATVASSLLPLLRSSHAGGPG